MLPLNPLIVITVVECGCVFGVYAWVCWWLCLLSQFVVRCCGVACVFGFCLVWVGDWVCLDWFGVC